MVAALHAVEVENHCALVLDPLEGRSEELVSGNLEAELVEVLGPLADDGVEHALDGLDVGELGLDGLELLLVLSVVVVGAACGAEDREGLASVGGNRDVEAHDGERACGFLGGLAGELSGLQGERVAHRAAVVAHEVLISHAELGQFLAGAVVEELSEHSEILVLVIVEGDSVAVEPDEAVELLVGEAACHHQGVEAGELDCSGITDVDGIHAEDLDGSLAVLVVLDRYQLNHGIVLVGDEALGLHIQVQVACLAGYAAERVGGCELLVVVENGVPAIGEVLVTFLEIDERAELAALVGILVYETVDQVSFLGSDSGERCAVVRNTPAEGLCRFLIAPGLEHEPGLACHVAFFLADAHVTVLQKAEIAVLPQCVFSCHQTLRNADPA